jgi:hypothetical protein
MTGKAISTRLSRLRGIQRQRRASPPGRLGVEKIEGSRQIFAEGFCTSEQSHVAVDTAGACVA